MEVNKIWNEPCLETTKRISDNSIDCIITSPPYWQLRDYGYSGQWGLEPTFNEYLEHLWQLMDECYRILKPTGTCWINLGDSYNGAKTGNTNGTYGQVKQKEGVSEQIIQKQKQKQYNSKCLLLIPHRFAIGCMDRGWIMRNDCIWAKRNGMPESTTDRFSKKHEYFFFMVKEPKYYFDLDVIRDKHKWASKDKRADGERHESAGKNQSGQYGINAVMYNIKGKNPGDVADFWDITTKPSSSKHYASYNDGLLLKPILAGCPEGGVIYDPFFGTGSTGEAALRSNRKFIGSEMSADYADIAAKRLHPFLTSPMLF